MNWIKKLYYTIFYRKNANKVMGALTECQAFKSYQKTAESKQKIIKEATEKLIDSITNDIGNRTNTGQFYSTYSFESGNVSKEYKIFIKKHFKDQGYKVKFGFYEEMYSSDNRYIRVSWKHWRR